MFCRRFGLLFQNMTNIVLEKIVKELKLDKVVVTPRYSRLSRVSCLLSRASWILTKQSVFLVNHVSRIINWIILNITYGIHTPYFHKLNRTIIPQSYPHIWSANTSFRSSYCRKCGREEVYRLVNDSLNKDITREAFELVLNSMTDNHSVNLIVIGKRECLSLPKESCQIGDDKVDQNNINFVKKFNLFKSGIMDDFDRLKQAFFLE